MEKLPDRIVYVDDDLDMREIIRQVFERAEYEGAFATCSSGQELLSRLRVLQPELILLDLVMPDMDGPDVLEKLQLSEEGKLASVIFMTGHTKLEMTEHYKKLGVIGVIHKPYEIGELLKIIEDIWCSKVSEEDDD